ncbi:HD domain-containing phosphohydrolase [uncultured Methylophaga sp.]|uniref:HD domain-containing phosphohydrolase n=1 Tax=uncultured Methylophaga sp. TaxID=285271 RepID=UPI00262CE685|nr:HD domain-containing phosphohydrolase [uncultured Methylophaga sp.]
MANNLLHRLTHRKLTIRVTVVTVFIFATLITAALAVGLQYYFTKQIATNATLSQFSNLSKHASQYLESVDDRAAKVAKVLSIYPSLLEDSLSGNEVRNVFAEFMRNNPMFYAIYIGFENGDFYELINLESSRAVRRQLEAAPEDRWVIIHISGQGEQRKREYQYYSANFELRKVRDEDSEYNATQRPWFQQATDNEVRKTNPYMFHNLQAPGQTYSIKVENTDAVIAVDIALSSLSAFFNLNKIGRQSEIFLYEPSGDLVASSVKPHEEMTLPQPEPMTLSESQQAVVAQYPQLTVSNEIDWAPIDFAVSGQPQGYSVDYLNMLSAMTGIELKFVNGFTWLELIERFKDGDIDLLQPVFKTQSNQALGTFSAPFIALPYSLVTLPGQQRVSHIDEMAGRTVAIPEGWSIVEVVRTHFPSIEVREVASTRQMLQSVKNGEVDAGLDIDLILDYTAEQYYITGLQFHPQIAFAPVAFPNELHLVMSDDKKALIDLLNQAIAKMDVAHKQALEQKWLVRDSHLKSTATVPYPELIELAGQPQHQQRLRKMQLDNKPHFVYVAPVDKGSQNREYLAIVLPVSDVLGPAMQRVWLSIAVTIAFLFLLMPIPWLFASPITGPIRELADENEKIKRRQFDQVKKPGSRIREIDELGQSMLAMSESIQQFEQSQKDLMDSFIRLIAEAIDDKSPYTAGHCERVPELAFMLTEKAEQAEQGIFQGFHFESKEEWREFKIAAWLHDCGKITTPEHVVDKGSKLETIYNRIHEIRTRFEVLLREAELDYWRQRDKAPERESEWLAELNQKQAQIRDDFDFVARMNVGGEFLSEEKKARIKDIAEITWTRYLDDRIGLSPLEETRLNDDPPTLPVEEKLLQDKPSHLIERLHSTDYDPKLGIKMDVPHYLYNQGELYNLLIARGTLTAEDRFKINEHIISTIRMLENLPFPDELKRVPRYASTHHETLIGTGYPRKLAAGDLSIPERIMVLADIYEALTAADRPYKKAKPISEAIKILSFMVEDQHIDREVFELFLTSGVYLEYARRFLPESQIDEIDISQYLRRAT